MHYKISYENGWLQTSLNVNHINVWKPLMKETKREPELINVLVDAGIKMFNF